MNKEAIAKLWEIYGSFYEKMKILQDEFIFDDISVTHAEILRYLLKNKSVTVHELSDYFKIDSEAIAIMMNSLLFKHYVDLNLKTRKYVLTDEGEIYVSNYEDHMQLIWEGMLSNFNEDETIIFERVLKKFNFWLDNQISKEMNNRNLKK